MNLTFEFMGADAIGGEIEPAGLRAPVFLDFPALATQSTITGYYPAPPAINSARQTFVNQLN
jgi:hypothetical protein